MSKFLNTLLAVILLVIFSPIFLITSLLIIIDNGFSIFYYQKRVGIDNQLFTLYKFRTMKKSTPEVATHLLKNPNEYLTVSGALLRKLSLDELPQLINIIKGQMRFVGPRPALYNQKNLILERSKLGIDKIYPGITGWAQINGRDNISTSEKVKLDKFYLDNKSLHFDIKIIILTIINVFISRNVSH
tara:strand:+ start:2514 stop:3074 length:561 start_codon:yes stop_codon:yes gene_type:complete